MLSGLLLPLALLASQLCPTHHRQSAGCQAVDTRSQAHRIISLTLHSFIAQIFLYQHYRTEIFFDVILVTEGEGCSKMLMGGGLSQGDTNEDNAR